MDADRHDQRISARAQMTNGEYHAPRPTGNIEVWDTDRFVWRLAKPDELVPALVSLVIELGQWRDKVRGA